MTIKKRPFKKGDYFLSIYGPVGVIDRIVLQGTHRTVWYSWPHPAPSCTRCLYYPHERSWTSMSQAFNKGIFISISGHKAQMLLSMNPHNYSNDSYSQI